MLVLYVALDLLLRPLALPYTRIIPWYPGAGIGLAFLVLAGPAWAPALIIARVVLYRLSPVTPVPILLALVEAALQTAAYAAAAEVIRRRVLGALMSWHVRAAAWLLGAIAASAMFAGMIGAVELTWWRGVPSAHFWTNVLAFAAGDVTGALVVLPVILLGIKHALGRFADDGPPTPDPAEWIASPDVEHPRASRARRVTRWERVADVVLVAGAVVISRRLITHGAGEYASFVCLLPLAWIALREGVRGAILVIATYGIASAALALVLGIRPDDVPMLQSLLLTSGVTGLLLGAAHTERSDSAARFWRLFETSGEGISWVDMTGRARYVNARLAEILGRPVGDLVGRDMHDFTAPADRPRLDNLRRQSAAGGHSTYEMRLYHPDGTAVDVVVNASVVRDTTTGEPLGALTVVTDVTPLRRAEVETQRARVLLETAFRSSRDAMILFREGDEYIIDVNDVWCQVTGYRREEVIGRTQKELRLWGDPADSARFAEAMHEHGSVKDFEITFNRRVPGGTPTKGYALLSAQPVTVGGITHFLVAGRDITAEKRRAETDRQVRRLEELGRLAGSIAHDFNNLLTVILGYAGLARMSLATGHSVTREDIDEIERAGQRGQELTKRLLAFSRDQSAKPRVIDARVIVDNALGMLKSALGPGVQLRIESADEPTPILADPAQVDQILLNLAVNARDAMAGAGTFSVSTTLLHAAPGEVAELVGPDALPGEYVVLRVHDTGSGMDEATREHIFEPFFTTKGPGEGTGLGLAVVYAIARQARGTVDVASAPGEGTTFTIYWPIASLAPVPSAPPAPTDTSETRPVGGRVLLVEDDVTVQKIARRVLEDAGYEVTAASNGVHALECLVEMKAAGTPPDIVLSDVLMPQLGGRALAEQLATRQPGLPVILMSGNSGGEDVRDRLPNVPLPIVAKPFDVAKLLEAISDVLAKRAVPVHPE